MTTFPSPGDVSGQVADGFADVRDAFAAVLAAQPGTGAAMAARHDGRWIARLHGGWADAARIHPWRADSIVMPYSVSKPFAAVALLVLVDRGAVELDAPVQRYWPEFTAPATVRHVLSHQAGVVALDEPLPTEAFYDWDRICAALARQAPSWAPGRAAARAPCSSDTWWARLPAGSTAAPSAHCSGRRSAHRSGSTSPWASAPPTGPARSS